MLTVLAFSACKDELESSGVAGRPGYLTFDVTDGRSWAENGNTRGGVEAPILMDCSLDGEPLYLHTSIQPSSSVEVQQEINIDDNQADTRGVRYTGDVFSVSSNGSPKISDFGVYGRTQDRSVTVFNFAQISPTTTAAKDDNVSYDWNVKEDDTMFQDWGSGLADFYGYAPYFANPSADNGLSMALNGEDVPVLTYVVPADVTKQLDILTAKQTGVEKNSNGTVVKLPFDHVMSAIKFKFTKGKEADGDPKTDYTWNDGVNTYNITINTIHINNVYKKGSWTVGDDPYNGGTWTVDTSAGTASFAYSPSKNLQGENGSEVELNPDNEGNVFMMLPQTVPSDATISLDCTMTNTANSTDVKTATLTATLKQWNYDGSGNSTTKTLDPMVWLPGYTYTYTISMSDIEYVFDYNTATAKNYGTSGTAIGYNGTSEENVFIRSYKIDSKGTKTNVEWWPEYLETEADAIGVGDGGADQDVWKKGSNGWIHVYDHSTGSYDTEVLADHGGANEGDGNDVKLFKIEVGSIMTPVKDLSMWNHDQTKRRRKRCTSNCYMVAGPGTYVIPLVYGNAITNGNINTDAYAPGVSQNNAWPTFKNAFDLDIHSPYINQDLKYHGRQEAVAAALVWAEGDAAVNGVTSALRTSMGSDSGHPAGYEESDAERAERNNGTVIKVIPDIDKGVYDDDGYNTSRKYAGANYIKFEVKPENFNYGNAVIGVRNAKPVGDNIVWSWHIWLVDPDWFIGDNSTTLNLEGNEVTYAKTNIGYVPGGVSVAAQTRTGHARLVQKETGNIITIDAEQLKRRAFTTYFTNVLYQWGRKDPIRGNVNINDMTTNYGAPRGPKGYRAFKNNMEGGGHNASIFVTSETATVGEMIRTPNTMYGQSDGDLYNYSSATPSNLWAAKLQKYYITNGGTWLFQGKTIYDPSPVGFCVPPSKYLTKLRRGGFGELSGSTQTDDQINQRGLLCTYTANASEGSGKTVVFQATGIRTTSGGYDLRARGLHQPGGTNAANGFYHTATPFTDDENWQLHLYFYSGIDTHNFIRGDMCECLSVKPVLWNGEIDTNTEVDPAEEPLTFTFNEAGALYWTDRHITQTSRTIEYSLNGGPWTSVKSDYYGSGSSSHRGTLIANVASRDVLKVRGLNDTYCIYSAGSWYYQFFHSTANYSLSGNIMSLIYGENFKQNETSFPSGSSYNFSCMFYDMIGINGNNNTQLEDIDGLVMPATTLRQSCYESMFQGCTNLVTAPLLPATAGVTDCYKNMFNGCSSLTTVKSMLHNPSTNFTSGWLSGVNSEGSFFYSKGVTTWPTGANGIPSGWAKYDIYD